jgi:hypothetical protein
MVLNQLKKRFATPAIEKQLTIGLLHSFAPILRGEGMGEGISSCFSDFFDLCSKV